MPGVRSVLIKNWTTFTQLDVKRTLKVAARFVQQKPEEMERVFDKAEARKEASVAVYEAIQRLWRISNIPNSYDLNFMNLVRKEVKRAEREKNSQRLDNPDFHVALNDWNWRATVGSRKGNLAILMKNRKGNEPRPALRDLEADLHKLAKRDPEKYKTALKLAALLDTVNKSPTQEDGSRFGEWADGLKKLGLNEEFAAPILSAINKKDLPGLANCIGEALTELLRPGLKTALQAARQCPVLEKNEYSLDHRYVLKMFHDHFDLFSGPEIWSCKDVKVSLYEYYGAALSITVLDKFVHKASFSKQDIALLKSTLKDAAIPEEYARNPKVRQQIAEEEKRISDAFAKINLKKDPEKVLFAMSKVVADHYIQREVLNLDYKERPAVTAQIESAKNADDIMKALKTAFAKAIEKKIDSQQFFQPLEDLASRQQQ